MKLVSMIKPLAPVLLACAALGLAGCADSGGSNSIVIGSSGTSSSGGPGSSGSGSSSSSSSSGSCVNKPGVPCGSSSSGGNPVQCPAGTTFSAFVNSTAGDADPKYTTEVSSAGICANCSVKFPDNVVNPDTASPAVMDTPLGVLGSIALTVTDTVNEYPAGDEAGFIVQVPGADLLTLALLNQVTVSTVEGGSPTGDSASTSSLIKLDLLSLLADPSLAAAVIPSSGVTKQFNGVSISLGGLVSALGELNVYTAGVCIPDGSSSGSSSGSSGSSSSSSGSSSGP